MGGWAPDWRAPKEKGELESGRQWFYKGSGHRNELELRGDVSPGELVYRESGNGLDADGDTPVRLGKG